MSKDSLYNEAVKIAQGMGYASTSLFQRRLRIGYARAAQILDQMEVNGFCEMFNPNSKVPQRRKLL